uniref:Hemerythrin-like domain-containing protein n=1 Tax=Thermogladius calderae TaxID=1200300 RepID=A0A7J3XXH9_9CREN
MGCLKLKKMVVKHVLKIDQLASFLEVRLKKALTNVNVELVEHILNEEGNVLLVVSHEAGSVMIIGLQEYIIAEEPIEELCKGGLRKVLIYDVKPPFTYERQNFLLGNRIMDPIHEEMFNLVTMIFTKIIEGDLSGVEQGVSRLIDHTKNKHFAVEERLMVKYGYDKYDKPGFDHHVRRHREFLEALNDIASELKARQLGDFILDFMSFIEDYLGYMALDDKKLALYLARVCGLNCNV